MAQVKTVFTIGNGYLTNVFGERATAVHTANSVYNLHPTAAEAKAKSAEGGLTMVPREFTLGRRGEGIAAAIKGEIHGRKDDLNGKVVGTTGLTKIVFPSGAVEVPFSTDESPVYPNGKILTICTTKKTLIGAIRQKLGF